MGDEDIRDMWEVYFNNLFNRGRQESTSIVNRGEERTWETRGDEIRRISSAEVKEALSKMGRAKSIGTDQIPIEVWK